MKDKTLKYLSIVIIASVASTLAYIFINGIPLLGIPDAEDVSFVEISDKRLDIVKRKITERSDIQNALNLTNFLLYKPGNPQHEEALIIVVFHLKDGNSFIIGSNEKTMQVNGKEFKFKGDNGEIFLKVAEGMFFIDALHALDESK